MSTPAFHEVSPAPAGQPSLRAAPADEQLLSSANVLIIGINYKPEPTGIAPYTAGMAEHFAQVAASVTVMTGVPHYPAWKVPEQYRGRARRHETLSGPIDLLRHSHYVPRRQSALGRGVYELSFMVNVLAQRVRRPDLVVAVSPSLGGAVAGARIAARFGVPLITVVQDLMAKAAGQSGMTGGSSAARATAWLERYALRRSTLVAAVSEAFFPTLKEYGVPEERLRLLPNWTHIGASALDRATARRELGWPDDRFLVLHTGNMGLKQDLGNVIEAARLLSGDERIRFLLLGDGSQRLALQTQAAGVPNLEFVDRLDDADYLRALAAADLLLVNERATVGDMSLPSKLTSYLSAGRPVLAAVTKNGATARELSRTGGAAEVVAPDHPQALADAVLRSAAEPEHRDTMSAAGKAFAAAHLGRDAAMGRLSTLAEEALGPQWR